jgi:hypothetical protein
LGTDYGFRIIVPKLDWVDVLSELAREQTWSNFKNEASSFARLKGQGGAYVQALHRIWEVMLSLQAKTHHSRQGN